MSLAAIFYPFYVHNKKIIFDFKSKNIFFSKRGFIKGYRSYQNEQKIIKEVRKHIIKGKLTEILKEFKKIIRERIELTDEFARTNLKNKDLNWVSAEFQKFHKFYFKYWSYHIFLFNLDKALENTKYNFFLKENEDLIKEVRGYNPFSFFDEEYLSHLFEYLGDKFKISSKKLYYLTPVELIEILKNERKIDFNEINSREKYYLLKWAQDKEKIYSGEKALKEYQKIISFKNLKATSIKGKPAFKGVAKGKAKLVFLREDLKKITKGDVLVAPMTLPDYLPAMKLAAAILTDEGGFLCHAAIISRELKIPCIIGTKIATKVLKDGDLVEVDANKGTIKIIK